MSTTKFQAGTVVASTWLNDVDRQVYTNLTGVAGTNTITAVGPNSATAYNTGQTYYFIPQNTNTGAVTINVTCNAVALGAKAITKNGATALVAGDLVAGSQAELMYDGTQFQLLNLPSTIANGGTGATTAAQALINLGATGRLLAVQRFTASGTYTPTTGTTRAIVKLVGGGGAGGGSPATAAGQQSMGTAGGSGAYTEALVLSPGVTAVTVGAGGVGVSGGNGGAGTTSSFSASITAPGGTGGAAFPATTAAMVAGAGAGGVAGIGGNIVQATGNNAWVFGFPAVAATPALFGVTGASGPFGGCGGGNGSGGAGQAAPANSGGGGGGTANSASTGALTGGNGGSGLVLVYEYA